MKRYILAAALMIAAIGCGSAAAQSGPDVRVIGSSCGWMGSGDDVLLHVEITAVNETGEDFIDAEATVEMLNKNGEVVMVVSAPYIGQWFGGVKNDTYFKRDLNIERSIALLMYDCRLTVTELGEPQDIVQTNTGMWGDHPEY